HRHPYHRHQPLHRIRGPGDARPGRRPRDQTMSGAWAREMPGGANAAAAVEVRDLKVVLAGSGIDVIDEISFSRAAGEILGLVGESGSGKTTVGLALLGHCRRGLRIAGGAIRIDGQDMLRLDESGLRAVRGKLVCYVPQDPATALNPALS